MPVFAFVLGLMGTAVLVRWCLREVQRVTAELEEVRDRPGRAGGSRGAADIEGRSKYRRVPARLARIRPSLAR
jgi:hypothetical protein